MTSAVSIDTGASEPKPWHRRDGETEDQYRAFCEYRDLYTLRTIDLAYQMYSGLSTKTSGHFSGWANKNEWRARALAYDQWQQTIIDDETAHALAKKQRALMTRMEDISTKLFDRAEDVLALPLTEQRVLDNGKTIIIKPVRGNLAHAGKLIEVGRACGVFALDMIDKRVTIAAGGGGKVGANILVEFVSADSSDTSET